MKKKRKWLFKAYVDWKEWGLVVEFLPRWPGWAEIQIGPFVAYWWNPVIDPVVREFGRIGSGRRHNVGALPSNIADAGNGPPKCAVSRTVAGKKR